jgi:hypothetical protein
MSQRPNIASPEFYVSNKRVANSITQPHRNLSFIVTISFEKIMNIRSCNATEYDDNLQSCWAIGIKW